MRSKRFKNAEGNSERDNDSVSLMENEMGKENEYSGNGSATKRRKSPHVYTVDDDVDILFAIQEVKSFGKKCTEISWKQVHHFKSDWNSKKNRFMNEIKWFTTNENKSKRGSGIVETYDLKDKLLTEILPLMKEAEVDKSLSTSDRNNRARDKAAGEEIRMAAVSSMASKVSQQKSISNDPDEDILEKEVMESNVTPKLKRRKDDILELIRVKDLAAQKTRE
ncbi:unnamed protein product [Allacma fusca]|uniref:Uncharacterized protein n=1 Tax=Allacma fusca TaxID=39272 RepID=A0A8J2JB02_9HEXA|nr:unnamed protein product [Allacma fusca]